MRIRKNHWEWWPVPFSDRKSKHRVLYPSFPLNRTFSLYSFFFWNCEAKIWTCFVVNFQDQKAWIALYIYQHRKGIVRLRCPIVAICHSWLSTTCSMIISRVEFFFSRFSFRFLLNRSAGFSIKPSCIMVPACTWGMNQWTQKQQPGSNWRIANGSWIYRMLTNGRQRYKLIISWRKRRINHKITDPSIRRNLCCAIIIPSFHTVPIICWKKSRKIWIVGI